MTNYSGFLPTENEQGLEEGGGGAVMHVVGQWPLHHCYVGQMQMKQLWL